MKFLLTILLSFSFIYSALNVAIIDLTGRGITTDEAQTLTDKLRSELVRSDKYTILERSEMDKILQEQGFQQTGCTSQECVVQAGQLLGVDKMIAGSVGKVGLTFLITTRLIDVRSGKILNNYEVEIEGRVDDLLKKGIPEIANKMANPYLPKSLSNTSSTPSTPNPNQKQSVTIVGIGAASPTLTESQARPVAIKAAVHFAVKAAVDSLLTWSVYQETERISITNCLNKYIDLNPPKPHYFSDGTIRIYLGIDNTLLSYLKDCVY